MSRIVVKYVIMILLLFALQVVICDHVALFGYATPIIFIYPLMAMPQDFSRNWLLTIAFVLGLAVDVWNDTPGMNSLCCITLAAVARPVFFLYMTRDDKTAVMIPSIRSMGPGNYCKYALTMTAIYCILIFLIEFFSFNDIYQIFVRAASSTVLSFCLILAIDAITSTDK